jgi:hypothetical protein
MAEEAGIVAGPNQCFGWKVHPLLGGTFAIENIGVFSTRMYQSLVGQLFNQVNNNA